MAVENISSLFDIGASILGSTLNTKTGTITVQTGDAINSEVHSDGAEWWQHIGFASRAAKSIPGKSSCQSIAITQSRRDICIASRDIRGNTIYGNLKEGETAIYAAGPSNIGTGRTMYKDDGTLASITHLVQEVNSVDGNPILMQLSSDAKINIANSTYGAISLDTEGIHIASMGKLDLGCTGALGLVGATLALNAGAVLLGASSNPVAYEGIVKGGPQFAAWTAAVSAALTALITAVATKPAAVGAPIDPSVAALAAGLTFPVGEISLSVKSV